MQFLIVNDVSNELFSQAWKVPIYWCFSQQSFRLPYGYETTRCVSNPLPAMRKSEGGTSGAVLIQKHRLRIPPTFYLPAVESEWDQWDLQGRKVVKHMSFIVSVPQVRSYHDRSTGTEKRSDTKSMRNNNVRGRITGDLFERIDED